TCLYAHDFDGSGSADGQIDLSDRGGFLTCFAGPHTTPPDFCLREGAQFFAHRAAADPPPSGTFALHGRPLDVLSDGHVLVYIRARFYDPKHSRWLQRDPTGYTDGNDLYESFRGNATRFTDPLGTEVGEEDYYAEKSKRAVEYARYLLGAVRENRRQVNASLPVGPENELREVHVNQAHRLRMELENLVRGSELGRPGYLDLNDPENYALVEELRQRGIAGAHIIASRHRYERFQVNVLKEGGNIVTGETLRAASVLGYTRIFIRRAGQAPTTAARAGVRTSGQLIEDIGTRARTWGQRKGLTGSARTIGAKQHGYAKRLLNRYQRRFGDRGLVTERSFVNGVEVPYGAKGSTRLDVLDLNTGAVWDYKFGTTPMSAAQRARILTHGPSVTSITEVVRP
ncbi:MAG: hypothetical protein GY842_14080, partial [bacterium]|nr:hypothetical protein [bacterium]